MMCTLKSTNNYPTMCVPQKCVPYLTIYDKIWVYMIKKEPCQMTGLFCRDLWSMHEYARQSSNLRPYAPEA